MKIDVASVRCLLTYDFVRRNREIEVLSFWILPQFLDGMCLLLFADNLKNALTLIPLLNAASLRSSIPGAACFL